MKLKKQLKMQESEFLDFWFTLLSFHLVCLIRKSTLFLCTCTCWRWGSREENRFGGNIHGINAMEVISKKIHPSISSRTQLLITIIEDVSDERRFYTTKSKSLFWGKVNIFWNNIVLRMAVLSKHLYCQLLCSLKHPLKVKMFAQNWLI